MKLYNHTSYPDALLKPILSAAARAVGAKSMETVVIIRAGARGGDRAHNWFQVARRFAAGAHARGSKWIRCNRCIEIKIPDKRTLGARCDALGIAEAFHKTSVHEFAHVTDFQNGRHFGEYNRRWANRPHEIRAMDATDAALDRLPQQAAIQDAIIALALAIEANGHSKAGAT